MTDEKILLCITIKMNREHISPRVGGISSSRDDDEIYILRLRDLKYPNMILTEDSLQYLANYVAGSQPRDTRMRHRIIEDVMSELASNPSLRSGALVVDRQHIDDALGARHYINFASPESSYGERNLTPAILGNVGKTASTVEKLRGDLRSTFRETDNLRSKYPGESINSPEAWKELKGILSRASAWIKEDMEFMRM